MAAIAMPQLGESVAEGTIVRWLKQVGETVRVDEPLFEVSTDKVNTEIPSLEAGVLSEILVAEGQTVPVGTILARIGETIARIATSPSSPTSRVKAPQAMSQSTPQNKTARAALYSPVVRKLAREHAIDLAQISGTGGGGRVTRDDVLSFVRTKAPPAAPAASEASLTQHQASGGRGQAAEAPMSLMRQQIAERVTHSKRTAVEVFSVIEADMQRVHEVRDAYKAAFSQREGFSLTYLPFIARAVVDALAAYPAVNSRIDMDAKTITHSAAIHLGIAVDLGEQGLIVPVIRDADAMNVVGIARRIHAQAQAARGGTLASADVSGSTFSITNNGAFGTLMTAAVINQPNVAILSTDVIEQRAVVVDGAVVARYRMYLCMTWDHRAIDGSTAGRFLARIKNNLETWDWSTQLA